MAYLWNYLIVECRSRSRQTTVVSAESLAPINPTQGLGQPLPFAQTRGNEGRGQQAQSCVMADSHHSFIIIDLSKNTD